VEHGTRLSAPVRALRITTAAEAAARDRGAINAGTPSFDLMLQAGTAAAAFVLREFRDRLSYGVSLFAGSGNNGGDAYVMAAQLARAGVAARVHATVPPRTPDAQQAARLAAPYLVHGAPTGKEQVVVDGLLGTGHRGPLRDGIWADCARFMLARDRGATVVALDLPSGLDASTGDVADGSVPAHVTLSFGTVKRGALLRRDHVGRLVLLDIGLRAHGDLPDETDDDAWRWADARALRGMMYAVPGAIAWNAHKGVRGRVGIAGGEVGMAGALVLAALAALRSGAGLVHAIADEGSVTAVQSLVPQALAHKWPAQPAGRRADQPQSTIMHPTPSQANAEPRYDALAIGPGLGRARGSAMVMQRLLDLHRGTPLVLDADALWLAADAASALGTDTASMLRHWTREAPQVVCTPHPGEFARLLGAPLADTWQERAALLAQFAARANCTVLLKGTPTLVAMPDGQPLWVVPHGTPMLATGGSGDCLTGVIATLLAQGATARDAAVLGASVHGRAAEVVTSTRGTTRGATLDDMLGELGTVWAALEHADEHADEMPPGVLAELPAV
jgi:ADP-dependent NAD(P)H-hydrate dehydratase / NAD(P)H-hydrate epimerase